MVKETLNIGEQAKIVRNWCFTPHIYAINRQNMRISCFGGHFGGHLEYLKTLKDARVASSRFGFSTLKIGYIHQKTLGGRLNKVKVKILVWHPEACKYVARMPSNLV